MSESLVFLLPILLALVLGVGAVLGGDGDMDIDADVDVDVDVDADADADADGDADGDAHGAGLWLQLLSLLGVGRAPVSAIVSAGLLSFGTLGMVLKGVVGFVPGLVLAALLAPVCAGFIGRTLGRLLPTSETFAIRREALVGCTGVARVRVSESFGAAQVFDDGGTLHEIRCRSTEGIDRGDPMVVLEYDEDSGSYVVAPLEAELC